MAARKPKTEPSETVKARVICAGAWGKVNDVVETAADIAGHASDLDADPAAVAYAESLNHESA